MYFIIPSTLSPDLLPLREHCLLDTSNGILCVEVQNIFKYTTIDSIIWEIYASDQSVIYTENNDIYLTNIIVNTMYDLSNVIQLETLLGKDDGFKLLSEDLFFWAIAYNHLNIVEYLIQNFNFYAHVDKGLKYACAYGNYDIVNFLTDIGANIHYDNDYCVKVATQKGYLKIVDLCITMDVLPQIEDNYLIKCAAFNGHLDIVDFLIRKGVNYRVENDTPFKYAAENGHLNVVEYFINHGISVNCYNNYAVRHAAKNGHVDTVKYLINKGANHTTLNEYALRTATMNNHLDVVKCLTENKSNIRIDNDRLIRYAIEMRQWDMVSYFLIHINFNV